jgi:ABC-2 type transport system ATP-binding protein
MKELLAKLHAETFVLDVGAPLAAPPRHGDFDIRLVDATTLEAVVDRRCSLNDLFSFLSSQDIAVVSMRNKANRLEELFVTMVRENERPADADTP